MDILWERKIQFHVKLVRNLSPSNIFQYFVVTMQKQEEIIHKKLRYGQKTIEKKVKYLKLTKLYNLIYFFFSVHTS